MFVLLRMVSQLVPRSDEDLGGYETWGFTVPSVHRQQGGVLYGDALHTS
jgi:hypothetical protein